MKRIIALICVLSFMSCQRDNGPVDNEEPNDDAAILYYTGILNEYVLANGVFQDVVNNTGDALLNAEGEVKGVQNGSNNGPEIVIYPLDLETFPKTITVDFGSGTLCEDGITRRGVITIVSTGWYGQLDSVHTLTFNDYYHDVFKVTGTQVIENWGENEDGHVVFSVTVEDGLVSTSDDVNITYDEASNRTWIAGSETPFNIWDDEYLLDGIQWCVSSDGFPYLVAFEPSLHFILKPREIKAGVVDLEIDGITGFKINFNNQTITVLGKTTTW